MNSFFSIIERFAPDAMEIIETRYQLLRQVMHRQPLGRRQLCKELGYSERLVRNEVDTLKSQGALIITPAGIVLTDYGEELLHEIDLLVPALYHTQTLALKIKQLFNLQQVIVVPGDSQQDPLIQKDLGRAAARFLEKSLHAGCTVAVTGGTTLAEMAQATGEFHFPDVLIVPARGGLGEEMELQAGAIAAKIAKAIGAQYRLLHIPDNLEENTAEILKRDSHIQEMVNRIKSSDILIHGVGPAMEMASRRGLSREELALIHQYRAVGEALRYYFDKSGNIVYETPGIGLELDDLRNISTVIAVAGGRNKAEAIKAVLSNGLEDVLLTDEGAAREIINSNGKDG
ncbi:MAG TPA: sugar-binding domain-containing protein [Syntrophomonadaceae bacterium]|nr:sugar-binding domain-containing protein [Syntrophomonadaceae bacterium]